MIQEFRNNSINERIQNSAQATLRGEEYGSLPAPLCFCIHLALSLCSSMQAPAAHGKSFHIFFCQLPICKVNMNSANTKTDFHKKLQETRSKFML